ncbi:MAG: winged helix-turn-helix domain-containing protein [Planctomycetes bacterium]|nr:winged helix-turn-helix domain-containing protein [Planctomycetota bacterium]
MRQNYRNNDPPTSAMAAHEAKDSGLVERHQAMCLDAVRAAPGLTAREAEALLGIKAHKRLPELRRSGLVRNGRPRPCTITGRMAMTWHPCFPTLNTGDRT